MALNSRALVSLFYRASARALSVTRVSSSWLSQLAALDRNTEPKSNWGFQHAREFHASGSVLQSNLLKTLREEIKYEKDNYEAPAVVASGPPAPFVLHETPGDTHLTLKRSFKNEEISVECSVTSQVSYSAEQPDGEQEESEEAPVYFNVNVAKGDKALVFECKSDGSYVEIQHISAEPKEGFEKESMYTGPVFEELDSTLQSEFLAYLEERGITAELGEYLRFLVHDKEQREYASWLSQVADFMAK